MSTTKSDSPIGTIIPGYSVPVINERAVRAAAGLLFLAGAGAVAYESRTSLQAFGMVFMVDMMIRLTAGDRWSPSLAAGRLIVSRQKPEWVGAPQKEFAWWLGFGLAFVSCMSMSVLSLPMAFTISLCSICLALLFAEASFGICVGCAIAARVGSTPQYCPGDTCAQPHSDSQSRSEG